jgi:hypothetical protein
MSDSLHRADTDLAELALGGLDGPSRAAVLAHLEQCESCRREATGFASTLDLLLLAVPEAPPAADLAARVDAAMHLGDDRGPLLLDGSAPRARGHRLRRRLLLGAAALVLVVAGVVGLVALWPSQQGVRTATMFDAFGTPMGRVELASDRATIVVSRPDGYAPLATTDTYRMRVVPRTGTVPVSGPLRFGTDDTWTGPLGVDPTDVARVDVVDPRGRVVCRARFPDA